MLIITARVTNIYISKAKQPVDRLNGFELDFKKGEIYEIKNIQGCLYVIDANGEVAHIDRTDINDFNDGRHLVFRERDGEFTGNRIVEFSIMMKNSSTESADPEYASELLMMIYEPGRAEGQYA